MAVRYLHVVDDLRRRITTGLLPVGSRLPSEQFLAGAYSVGRPTLRRALDVLQDEGLVEKVHGSGNFVRRPIQPITYVSGRTAAAAEQAAAPGLNIGFRVSEVEAYGVLPSLLQVLPGTLLIECVYLSEQDGLPRSLTRVYVPSGLQVDPPRTGRSPWGEDVREELVASGVQIASCSERIAVRIPTREEAEALRLTTRTCVLAIERTSTDVSGRVVEGALLVLPSDRANARFTTCEPIWTEAGR
ncbi:GntR family transcriptional regulator [Kitasatospora sp. GP82]|uniref:GntR family transcriptional regulator n=1 Tax=Kitasatospora sp. GP82 TaxID=3035089 RepID=UPI0024747D4F|nr:GntR family transcriptional regulator [Kitasatospora sp. GP82]MDH6127424.1 GntR family transcriptional regulator [Kitasatospora sp. GP82]